MAEPVYLRVVIKLSGEYFAGPHSFGMDQPTIDRIAGDLIAAKQIGVEVAVVVGGGNMVRGVEVSSKGVSRPTGDTMGMLATLMNCLALEAAIELKDLVAQLADMVEVHHRTYIAEGTVSMARQRRGGQFDPAVVDVFVD